MRAILRQMKKSHDSDTDLCDSKSQFSSDPNCARRPIGFCNGRHTLVRASGGTRPESARCFSICP